MARTLHRGRTHLDELCQKPVVPAFLPAWPLPSPVGFGRVWGKVCHFWRLADQRLQLVEEQHPPQPVLPEVIEAADQNRLEGHAGLERLSRVASRRSPTMTVTPPMTHRAHGKSRGRTVANGPKRTPTSARRTDSCRTGASVPPRRSRGPSAALRRWVTRTFRNPRFRTGPISVPMSGSGRVRNQSGRRTCCLRGPQRSCLRAVSRFTAKGIRWTIVGEPSGNPAAVARVMIGSAVKFAHAGPSRNVTLVRLKLH